MTPPNIAAVAGKLTSEELDALAADLTKCERDLLLDNVNGWGAWIWETSGSLIAKGLYQQDAPGNRQPSKLGLALRQHLLENGGG